MRLFIIRHGEPNYDIDRLTEHGWKQAEAVGRRLAKVGIDRVFSSPMGRAKDTATPTCRLLGLEYGIEEWAHEIGDERLTCFPDGKRKSVSLVQNSFFIEKGNFGLGYDRAYECQGFNDTKMREAVAKLEKCGDEFLERLGYRKENDVYRIIEPSEENVALFCHAAMARAWLSVLLKVPIKVMWASFSYEFTGVTELEFRNNENGITAPRCIGFSDLSHLYAENIALNGK